MLFRSCGTLFYILSSSPYIFSFLVSSSSLASFLKVSFFLSIFLTAYLSFELSTYLRIYLCIYLSIYLSIHISICVSIYVSIYLSNNISMNLCLLPFVFCKFPYLIYLLPSQSFLPSTFAISLHPFSLFSPAAVLRVPQNSPVRRKHIERHPKEIQIMFLFSKE